MPTVGPSFIFVGHNHPLPQGIISGILQNIYTIFFSEKTKQVRTLTGKLEGVPVVESLPCKRTYGWHRSLHSSIQYQRAVLHSSFRHSLTRWNEPRALTISPSGPQSRSRRCGEENYPRGIKRWSSSSHLVTSATSFIATTTD